MKTTVNWNEFVQYAVLAVLFILAVYYVSRNLSKSLKGKKSCGKGCGCAIDKPRT